MADGGPKLTNKLGNKNIFFLHMPWAPPFEGEGSSKFEKIILFSTPQHIIVKISKLQKCLKTYRLVQYFVNLFLKLNMLNFFTQKFDQHFLDGT